MRMAVEMVDGCNPSKLVQEDMEVGKVGAEVGQFKASQDIIRESEMGTPRWLTAVSKCQCEIIRIAASMGPRS